MAPRKKPTPPISLNVRILALTDRHHHPYGSLGPKYAFTVRLLPDTLIREACTHAVQYLDMHFKKFVDGSRLEARDVNGHVFDGEEAIGQELGDGGDLYLIEEALDVNEPKKAWLRDLDAKEKSTRTPKAKKTKEPRKTPSQRNLDIAMQGGRMVKTEPRKTPLRGPQASWVVKSEPKRRPLPMAPLELEDRNSPPAPISVPPKPQQERRQSESLVQSIEDSPPTTLSERRRHFAKQPADNVDASEHSADITEAEPPPAKSVKRHSSTSRPSNQDDASATLIHTIEYVPHATNQAARRNFIGEPAKAEAPHALAVASQRQWPQPISKAADSTQDERVIPDSPDPPSPLIEATSQHTPMASSWKPINASRSSAETQSRSARQQNATRAQLLVDAQTGIKQNKPEFLLGKPDPYDISAVLTDDEYLSPRQSKTIMSSSIRKLGSATKRTAPTSASVPRNSLLIAKEPRAADKRTQSPVYTKSTATSQDDCTVPATPFVRASHKIPAGTGPPSAVGPLLSSPTNHVAAGLARGRAQARRQPQPECIVIEDSDVEAYQDVLVDTQDQNFSSRRESKSLEASLPWSAPPLRMGGEDPFWTLRTTGRRTSTGRKSDVDEDSDARVEGNKALDVTRSSVVPTLGCDDLEPQRVSTSAISSFNLGPPLRDPNTPALQEPTSKSPAKSLGSPFPQTTAHKPPLLLVHGSSSSEQGVEEIGYEDDRLADSELELSAKIVEPETVQNSSSQDVAEDEAEAHGLRAESQVAEALYGDEDPIKPCQIPQGKGGPLVPNGNEADLPVINQLSARPSVPFNDHNHHKDVPSELARDPESDPKSENFIEMTPPSGQSPKRKRELQDDLDSGEERRIQKKARHEARTAKKIERKRLRRENMAQEEERLRNHQVWLQEERKRLASEKAYRRARELEIVVSSPSKAAEMGLNFSDASDSHQETELGSSPPVHAAVFAKLEGSDDSLGSKESEGGQSWRKLSKRHFSASPSSNLKDDVAKGLTGMISPGTNAVTKIERVHAVTDGHDAKVFGMVDGIAEASEPVQRRTCEDWAHLEAVMGDSVYSPLQVHNKIHMQMLLASLRAQTSHGKKKDEDSVVLDQVADKASISEPVESRLKSASESQNSMRYSSDDEAQAHGSAEDEDEDEGDITQQTARSPAPSPKDLTSAPKQASKQHNRNRQNKKDQKKNKRRRSKDNKRKKKWRRNIEPGICKQLKRKHTLGPKGTER